MVAVAAATYVGPLADHQKQITSRVQDVLSPVWLLNNNPRVTDSSKRGVTINPNCTGEFNSLGKEITIIYPGIPVAPQERCVRSN